MLSGSQTWQSAPFKQHFCQNGQQRKAPLTGCPQLGGQAAVQAATAARIILQRSFCMHLFVHVVVLIRDSCKQANSSKSKNGVVYRRGTSSSNRLAGSAG